MEFLTTRLLAHAALGDLGEAGSLQTQIATPLTADCQMYELASRAIIALRDGRRAASSLNALHRFLLESGCADGFVAACRAYPPLAEALVRSGLTEGVAAILERAAERRLIQRLGLRVPFENLDRAGTLSAREREIHELLAQGLTNKQIARTLFISDVTVKVHVRHIFQKLGVRSRVEAATRFTKPSQ